MKIKYAENEDELKRDAINEIKFQIKCAKDAGAYISEERFIYILSKLED